MTNHILTLERLYAGNNAEEAEKRKIQSKLDFYYPAGRNVNAFDVGVILNNGLSVAVPGKGNSTRVMLLYSELLYPII